MDKETLIYEDMVVRRCEHCRCTRSCQCFLGEMLCDECIKAIDDEEITLTIPFWVDIGVTE